MSESKTEPVWSVEPPEWINFFSNDMFLDYKEFVSKKLPLKYPSLGSGQSYDYAEPYSSFKGSRADFGRGSYSDSRKLFLQKSGRILWIISCILVFLGMIAALGVAITLMTADKSGTKGSFNSDFVNKSGISLTTLIPDPVT
ncbi:uncharacterized protein LOC118762993 isoform X2 [Octopus sinensis]|uniref:Uncharacterized protein LOC118762993 isoform X2 n=1 Tax=Octopus sinensis TaxID=2607531 RepID=A0A7E6ERP0_9MOLL|nr:uncharacterized protein LOC118762993 isoform X2 [Octopus sinensis]